MLNKNIAKSRELVDKSKQYTAEEAVAVLKQASFAKFDETLDIVMKLNVDPRHSNQMVRGVVPINTGKKVRVLVICKKEREEEALKAGADLAGSDEVIENIQKGEINFDVCIATPDMMGVVGRVARVLGPKGLMPNPKLGTVSPDISGTVQKVKSGQVEFRVEKGGIIHAGIGKVSFDDKELVANVNTFIEAVNKAKPTGVKGVYVKGVYLSTTMGPAVKVAA